MPTQAETRRKINGFAQVATGWHFGDGVPASAEAVILARLLNDTLYEAGFPNTDAFLGVGGQIQVNGYWGDLYLEFVYEDGLICFSMERGGLEVVEEDDLGPLDAITRINYWGKKWVTSESSTKTTSIIRWGGLLFWVYNSLSAR